MSPQPPCLKQREVSTVGGGVGRLELEDKRGRQNNKHLFLASFLEVALHIREKKVTDKEFLEETSSGKYPLSHTLHSQ